MERIAAGSVSTIYRCRFFDGPQEIEGTLKVVRDGRTNDLLASEAATLHRLFAADPEHRFKPFLPFPQATFAIAGGQGQAARQATVFRTHPEIRSPADELYTLDEVRSCFPNGLDARQAAWIWRRVLTVLGYAHANGIVHGAVLPPHLLVEPREHKLVLIDWCCAVPAMGPRAVRMLSRRHEPWYKREFASRSPPSPALDIALAARSMVELMGGNPQEMTLPASVDAALGRYFSRCAGFGPMARPESWRLLEDFDRLIDAVWGQRRFVPLALPPKLSQARSPA